VANHGKHAQIDVISSEYAFLAGSALHSFEWSRPLADHLGQTFYDLGRFAPEHPGLGLSINKELIDKAKPGESYNVFKDNRIIGLGNQGAHMLEFHRFLYNNMLILMIF
jgi:hypothetical protein